MEQNVRHGVLLQYGSIPLHKEFAFWQTPYVMGFLGVFLEKVWILGVALGENSATENMSAKYRSLWGGMKRSRRGNI